jgi:hypothetical protein
MHAGGAGGDCCAGQTFDNGGCGAGIALNSATEPVVLVGALPWLLA